MHEQSAGRLHLLALRDWQHHLQHAILGGEPSPDLLHAVRQQGVIPRQRISIYQEAYQLRLTEALSSNYPAITAHLGAANFSELASAYTVVHPSRNTSIRWFGDRLARFLQTQSPWSSVPLLCELASFEWALRHTVDAGDEPFLTVDALRALPVETWPELVLQLQSAATIHFMDWNTPAHWSCLVERQEPPDLTFCPQHWLIYRRQDLMAMWRSAGEHEARLLLLTTNGLSFADLCEALAADGAHADTIPARAAQLLRQWAEAGLLVDTTFKN